MPCERPESRSATRLRRCLPLAQQSIDLLALLQEKTRGNLSEDEARFLDPLLYDLRVRYVAAAGRPAARRAAPAEPAKH